LKMKLKGLNIADVLDVCCAAETKMINLPLDVAAVLYGSHVARCFASNSAVRPCLFQCRVLAVQQ
jgi:hypothetical protein